MTNVRAEAGDRAPPFNLPGDGGPATLASFKGRKLVLYFYPKDDTSGCTREAIDFNRLHRDFEKAGAIVVGVSPDSRASHDKFKAKHKLSLALLADETRAAI